MITSRATPNVRQLLRRLTAILLAYWLFSPSETFSAAGWDTSFNGTPTLYQYESIGPLTVLDGTLYAAVNYENGPNTGGRLIRYVSGNWVDVPNGVVSGKINAISGGTIYGNFGSRTRLFVGGKFSTVGSANMSARNVASIDPTTTNGTWHVLQATVSGTTHQGVDDEVFCLQVNTWKEEYYSVYYDCFSVFIGGSFLNVGTSLSAKAIVQWRGYGSLLPHVWNTLAGGLSNTGHFQANAIVRGVTVKLAGYASSIENVFVTGTFRTAIGSDIAYSIARFNGHSNVTAWAYMGRAFDTLGYNHDCELVPRDPYVTYGNAAAMLNTGPFLGGSGDGLVTSSGNIVYQSFYLPCVPDCNNNLYCGLTSMPLISGSGNSANWNSGMNPDIDPHPDFYIGRLGNIYLNGLSAYNASLYIACPSSGDGYTAYKYTTSGGVVVIDGGAGSPYDAGELVSVVTAHNTSAYFASEDRIFRYKYF